MPLIYAPLRFAQCELARSRRHPLSACAEAARRLDEVCEREPSVRDPLRPAPLPDGGDLVVEGVSARYGPGEPWVLRDVSLRLAPGRRVALMGPSGAGKTTLAMLLARFRDPDEGAVRIGGADVRELTQDDVRRAVVVAGQDAHLFNTTVRENVQLARRDASEAELWVALRAAGAEDWVRDLPQGLDTHVGEDGALLSGGQRQRVALARALLSDARFLVLDEPTAHLDADTAQRVMADIAVAAGSRGMLVITHDGAGLERFDEVLELRGGELRRRAPIQ
jgi:ABC-type multidrug transport system fused ATPase/permease subunit